MKCRFLLILLTLLFCANASASCEIWQEGSTNWQACLEKESQVDIQEQINQTYNEIVKKFTSINMPIWIDSLKASQEQWRKYMEYQCQLEEHAFGGIGHISQIKCERRISELRLDELKTML